jgi:hypothetical protein
MWRRCAVLPEKVALRFAYTSRRTVRRPPLSREDRQVLELAAAGRPSSHICSALHLTEGALGLILDRLAERLAPTPNSESVPEWACVPYQERGALEDDYSEESRA